ncbi:MAG: 3D-(3,5/4)-trihydroxycyclohexane-1,2-dione acylhydrolase (decyclizing) [Oscillospiraceae bacterium]|nr:3D-(3,5/4)-trihydroxycyclohexane-1,2-dione acylhydrolase (decyclizing) [Oscillospiraceae bacterium]MDD7353707.1 3D-(3,5/4)-trihydroxycyclohexane-1,2-dione acylhydrolase (decyclizing) [Oscillospiraceae bacterium]MDY3936945.1 3D-(3,5/4)-trihydroxycyclohexane-1,2-dione acylhydrolase (decyclizing) [Oscillospiraceae bacterium]
MPKMTMAQALVKFLDNQYVSFDGVEAKFVEGVFTVFGHGIVVGLGQALDEDRGSLKVFQGKNEQGMAHCATAFAKQNNRRKIIACSSSIGPGSANMVTAAATATVNHIPLLLLPADTFATRQPDPVLQQFEQPGSLSITTNDAFKPVCRYWDRVTRPEQLMTAMINAMRALTDVGNMGAVCVSIPQDVEGESYDYPDSFFEKRVHRIARPVPQPEEIDDIASIIAKAEKPLVICGGGVRYSEAGDELCSFCEKFNIPYADTQSGKSATKSSHHLNLGGIGVTGNAAANSIAKDADVIIGIGTRFSDFTTASKSLYQNPNVKFVTINTSRFDAYKLDAVKCVGDAKLSINALSQELEKLSYKSGYTNEIKEAKDAWLKEMKRLAGYRYDENFEPMIKAGYESSIEDFVKMTGSNITQTSAVALIREVISPDAIAVAAAGSLPGCLQRMWTTDVKDSYNMEYGYSCMGYEIAGALGSKLAEPDREVYAFCGDGSYLMLHSELVTSIQERKKINVLLFDNSGFGCINNLQMSNGIGNLATEFRSRDDNGELLGDFVPIDFAKCASGYGVKAYTAKNLDELRFALEDSKKQTVSTLIDIKVLPKTMTDGYGAWWHVGIASTSSKKSVNEAYENKKKNLNKARKY